MFLIVKRHEVRRWKIGEIKMEQLLQVEMEKEIISINLIEPTYIFIDEIHSLYVSDHDGIIV